MADVGLIIGLLIGIPLALYLLYSVYSAFLVVREKECVIVERLGQFHSLLNPGVYFLVPFLDHPKEVRSRYYISNPVTSQPELVDKTVYRISLQNEVLDFPKTAVISRDNASCFFDAILSYQIESPVQMAYSVHNLPNVLSKLLQAQLRNVAASLDVDQMIEDSGSLAVLTRLMNAECSRWGVRVNFVKIQQVVPHASLVESLNKKKNADLQNKQVIISAKASKQTLITETEGKRDSQIIQAEGSADNTRSKARGEAEAIVNVATAEAKSIQEIASAIKGDNPIRYMLSQRYLQMLRSVVASNTNVHYIPTATANLQVAQTLGMNTLVPNSNTGPQQLDALLRAK